MQEVKLLLLLQTHTNLQTKNQAFSQNLKSGRPGGMSPYKFVKALVYFVSFSLRISGLGVHWTPGGPSG